MGKLGPFARKCNPNKSEADIWGWLEDRRSAILHYRVNQRPHCACWQYGHTGGTRGWLGVKRCQLCMQDTSRPKSQNDINKQQWGTGIHNELSCCVKCCRWLIVYQDGDYLCSDHYSQTICLLLLCWNGSLFWSLDQSQTFKPTI